MPVREFRDHRVIVFVTVCASARKSILNRPEVHYLLVNAWRLAVGWKIGCYVLMPDHLHLFCSPVAPEYTSLARWVQYWKANVSRSWLWPEEQPIWQKSFWDVQLRKNECYEEKWQYVLENPVRRNLVARSKEWPFQGEIDILEWY